MQFSGDRLITKASMKSRASELMSMPERGWDDFNRASFKSSGNHCLKLRNIPLLFVCEVLNDSQNA